MANTRERKPSRRPNLLVLDEPTNRLDIEMREALAQALQDFEGTLIVVAHDRHLLEAATDQWWLVADGRVAPFDGNLDDYREWSRQYRVRGTKAEEGGRGVDRKAQKRAEAEGRQRLAEAKKPFEKRIAGIEKELAALLPEKESLDAWLASGEAYADAMRAELAERSRHHGEVAARIAQLEEDWLWANLVLLPASHSLVDALVEFVRACSPVFSSSKLRVQSLCSASMPGVGESSPGPL